MGDFMINPLNSVNSIKESVHILYNDNGKSFEELLSEGIRQVNLQVLQKQIITNAMLEKGAMTNE